MDSSGHVNASTESAADIGRGPDSAMYVYTLLGFILTIEGIIVAMILPGQAPGNLLIYLIVGGVTVWLVLFNAACQAALLRARTTYESRLR